MLNLKTNRLMKKLFIFLSCVLAIGFVSCNDDDKEEPNYPTKNNYSNNNTNNGSSNSNNGTNTTQEKFTYTGTYDTRHYVNLDLPSKTLWATENIGASSQELAGYYYAWGQSYYKPFKSFNWSSYELANGSYNSLTKYCTSAAEGYNGFVDYKTLLEEQDDGGSGNLSGGWTTPTHEQFVELVNNCYWVWTNNYKSTGHSGYIVYKAKATYDKGKLIANGQTPFPWYSEIYDVHIFLPDAGERNDETTDSNINAGEGVGKYWTKNIDTSTQPYFARCITFYKDFIDTDDREERCMGLSMRPVISYNVVYATQITPGGIIIPKQY